MEELTHLLASRATKLMKLKMSNMNLQNEKIVDELCNVVLYNKYIIKFDVSYG